MKACAIVGRIQGRPARILLGALLLSCAGCAPGVNHTVTAGGGRNGPPVAERPPETSKTPETPETSRASRAETPKAAERAGSQPGCAADEGPSPSCARLSDATCLGASLARRACETAGPLLLPGVAERWVSCLAAPATGGAGAPPGMAHAAANPDAACDSSRILRCAFGAAESACVDGAFHELCGAVSEDCADVAPEITSARCEQLLGAFRPSARPKLIDCLKQGCGSGSFGVCLP